MGRYIKVETTPFREYFYIYWQPSIIYEKIYLCDSPFSNTELSWIREDIFRSITFVHLHGVHGIETLRKLIPWAQKNFIEVYIRDLKSERDAKRIAVQTKKQLNNLQV
jgi:hypothetical protein